MSLAAISTMCVWQEGERGGIVLARYQEQRAGLGGAHDGTRQRSLSAGSAGPKARSMSHASRQGSAASTLSVPMRKRGGKLLAPRYEPIAPITCFGVAARLTSAPCLAMDVENWPMACSPYKRALAGTVPLG